MSSIKYKVKEGSFHLRTIQFKQKHLGKCISKHYVEPFAIFQCCIIVRVHLLQLYHKTPSFSSKLALVMVGPSPLSP